MHFRTKGESFSGCKIGFFHWILVELSHLQWLVVRAIGGRGILPQIPDCCVDAVVGVVSPLNPQPLLRHLVSDLLLSIVTEARVDIQSRDKWPRRFIAGLYAPTDIELYVEKKADF